MHKIKYSNQAELDLHDAIAYIAKENVNAAFNYLQGYEDKIELLRSNPNIGTYCKVKNIQRDCRVLVYKSHIIIYKVESSEKEIMIIRIFHHSEDYINSTPST